MKCLNTKATEQEWFIILMWKKKKKKKNCKDATHLNCFIFIKPHYS